MTSKPQRLLPNDAVRKYSEFVKILIQAECPVLWHCTAGKDRAGIGAVIVEEILGLSRDDIISDYLRTNDYIENDVKLILEHVKKQTGITDKKADESIRILFGALRDYIDSFTVSKKDEENRKLRINSMEKIFTRIYNKKQIRLSTNYS